MFIRMYDLNEKLAFNFISELEDNNYNFNVKFARVYREEKYYIIAVLVHEETIKHVEHLLLMAHNKGNMEV